MNIEHKRLGANKSATYIFGGTVNKTLFFSYDTCVALQVGGTIARRDRNYSKTTAKHMTQMGVKNWPMLPDAEFEALASI